MKKHDLKPGKLLKTKLIEEYSSRIKDSSALFVTDFRGLTSKDMEDLRKKLRAVSAKYIIVKNSLCAVALKELKISGINNMITGACALSYGSGDPVAISKVLVNFSKANVNLKVVGGYIEGGVIDANIVKELAATPPREVLLTRLVMCMNGPITGFVTACSGILKKFVYALDQIKKKKEGEV